jgi:hypothetical protein
MALVVVGTVARPVALPGETRSCLLLIIVDFDASSDTAFGFGCFAVDGLPASDSSGLRKKCIPP